MSQDETRFYSHFSSTVHVELRNQLPLYSERCDHKRSGETPCGRKVPLSNSEAKVSNVPIDIPKGLNDVGWALLIFCFDRNVTRHTVCPSSPTTFSHSEYTSVCCGCCRVAHLLISSDRAGMVMYQQSTVRKITWRLWKKI